MSFFDVLKLLGPVVLLLGLLYGVLVVVKKYAIPVRSKKSGNFKINILNTQMILPKKYVSVVKIKDKMLVLGVSDNSINLLKEMEAAEEDMNEELAEKGSMNFFEMLRKNMTSK